MSRRHFFRVLVAAVALTGVWIGLGVTPCSAQLARAIQAQARNTNNVFGKNGVVGMGIGLNQNGQHVIKVYVVNAGNVAAIPKTLDGVPVVVQVTGQFFAMDDSTTTARQARPGQLKMWY